MRRIAIGLLILVTVLAGSSLLAKENNKLPLNFVLEPIITGIDRPSAMAIAGDGRIYIAERTTGAVRLVLDGRLLATPVLTVSVATGGDEGLLDIAYDPNGPSGGYLFLYYTDVSGDNMVYRYTLYGVTAGGPLMIRNLGSSPGHTRVGGGLEVGNDGYLYISVGDMEVPGDAQSDGSNRGKVLRLTSDGGLPGGQTSDVYAKGFRDGVGLAAHPDVSTVYLTDRGPVGGFDELNAVAQSGNHGWDNGTGPLGGGFDDPINDHDPLVDPKGLSAYTGTHFPDAGADGWDNDFDGAIDERDETYADSIFYACKGTNDVVRSVLTGAALDQQQGQCSVTTTTACQSDVDCPGGETCIEGTRFFRADAEMDYGPDADCPTAWTDLAEGPDGMLYAVSEDPGGSKGGLYRFVYDAPGPREVSPPGSLIPLTIERNGTDINLYWENVDRDAWVGTVTGATQPAQKYTIWEGNMPFTEPTPYSHAVHTNTDGGPVTDHAGVLTAQITPGSGDRYYLVSAQGANYAGDLGGGRAYPAGATREYCDEIGWYDNEYDDATKELACDGLDDDGDGRIDESCPGSVCAPDFVDGLGAPARMLDQFGNYWTMHDFRGKVIHLDISALDCYYCRKEAQVYSELYDEYKGRGFTTITALMNTYSAHDGIAPANCAGAIQDWIDNWCPGTDKRVLCAVDDDTDGIADIYEQYGDHLGLDNDRCTGTPQNLYFDQGLVMYDAVCGKYRGECQVWKCDGDQADCNTDADCAGHGGSEICDKSQVISGTCYLLGGYCEDDTDCPLTYCDKSCHSHDECTERGGRVCWHPYDRAKVEEKLYPERCE